MIAAVFPSEARAVTGQTQAATLDAVVQIARDAGTRIMEIYDSEFAVTHKDDDSPLTQADLAAHRYIVEQLARLDARVPVLSEEAAATPWPTRRNWTRYWLVDPLDGTKEFVKRNGEFTVNIALIENGAPTLGVVHAPAQAKTYLAAAGLGAQLLTAEGRAPIRCRPTPARPAFVVSRSHADAALAALLARLPAHDAVSQGSSLKFCLVAAGTADLYPRTGPTSEWDTAAGQCVAEAAGAQVLRLPELDALRYNQKESLLNPGFVVIGDPAHGWAARMRP
jgi:3'(2'), 5'-bisphosphate nucleotidase